MFPAATDPEQLDTILTLQLAFAWAGVWRSGPRV